MIFAASKANGCKDAIRPFTKLCVRQMLRAINQGQLDILPCGGARQQIKILEDEADLAIPDIGELISIQSRNICAVQDVMTRRRPVETTQNIHKCGFSGTARTHKRNKFDAFDLQRHTAHGGHFHFACAVRLMNID
jgi:hypothetical protein